MSLTLNKVSDEIVRENIQYQEKSLAKLLGAPADSRMRSDPAHYANSLASTTFELGVDYYQQQQPDERVQEKLSQAAQFLSQSLVLRHPDPQEMRQPTEYEKALDLAFCFGSPETLAQALRVTDEQIFSQPDPRNAELYRSNLMYCQILRRYLSGESLDLSAVREALARCEQDNAWKFDRFNTFHKLKTLEAIQAQDQGSFNKSLSLLVEDHKNEARHGDLQRLPDANLCLPALLLAKLGKLKADLACSVKSPYLPIHLVV